MTLYTVFIAGFVLFLLSGIRIIYEYKRALKFRFGKYIALLNPGFRWIIPLVDRVQIVDIRIITTNIDKQEVMTKDNVPCRIDGVGAARWRPIGSRAIRRRHHFGAGLGTGIGHR